jgi:hypothetical protein
MFSGHCSGLRLILAVIFCVPFAHAQKIPEPKPVWRTDLQQTEFTPGASWPFSLSFGRDGHILLAFLTPKIGGKTGDGSRELHLMALDAAMGRIVAIREIPTPGSALGKLSGAATDEGNFVMMEPDALCVYSADLQEKDRINLNDDPPSTWELLKPPGRHLIFLQLRLYESRSLWMLTTSPLRKVR